MSQAENAAATSSKPKRAYRKGNPLSATERQQAAVARKRETHKEVKIFVENGIKTGLLRMCNDDGVTQSELISTLLTKELAERGLG